MRFKFYGHEKILAEHPTTLEFTKEEDVTYRGDCIIGVNADFSLQEIRKFINKNRKIKITIIINENNKVFEEFFAETNKDFDDDKELVIRKSNFLSKRTFAVNSNKAAVDLSTDFVKELKNEKNSFVVEMKGVKIKAIIFDFDNTLEDFRPCEAETEVYLAEEISKKTGIKPRDFLAEFNRLKRKSIDSKPKITSRSQWFKDVFSKFKIKENSDEYERKYWDYMNSKVELFPNTFNVLKELGDKYKLVLFSETDGKKEFKTERIKKLGIENFFDIIFTTDDSGLDKSDKGNFDMILAKLNVKPEECIIVGDRPPIDLKTAKILGMTTVWSKQNLILETRFGYVDYAINDIIEILNILKRFR